MEQKLDEYISWKEQNSTYHILFVGKIQINIPKYIEFPFGLPIIVEHTEDYNKVLSVQASTFASLKEKIIIAMEEIDSQVFNEVQ